MMRLGKMYKAGDVVITTVQFTDSFDVKTRPALVLFEDHGNVVVAGITSNLSMKGILLSKEDGVIKDSVIKLNYIFTISEDMIQKKLFNLTNKKKKKVYEELVKNIGSLID